MKVRVAAGLKTRKHHNTKGSRQVRRGKTADQVKAMCKRLGLPFRNGQPPADPQSPACPAPGRDDGETR